MGGYLEKIVGKEITQNLSFILGLNLLYQWIEALFFSFTVLKKECIAGIENAVKHLSETGISVLFLKMRQKQKIHFKNG